MTREIFAELTQRLDVRSISWNKRKNYYTELGRTDFGFLTRSFAALRWDCRPEWRGGDPLTEFCSTTLPRRETNPNDSYGHVLATLR